MLAEQHLLSRLPARPYCTDNPRKGLIVRPMASAIAYSHIQLNRPLEIAWLAFDVDRVGAAFAWEAPNLPPPTATVTNPANGHAHLLYALKTPVLLADSAREAPRAYAAAIKAAFAVRLRADRAYAGLIAKNPLHHAWRVIWVDHLYELGELAEYVDLAKEAASPRSDAEGRNCNLFNGLRRWAYQHVSTFRTHGGSQSSWTEVLLQQATALNDIPNPLPFSEVRQVARSVAQWTWKHFDETAFIEKQSARGRKGGRPRTVTADGEPWLAMGVSRATYYRRMRNAGA